MRSPFCSRWKPAAFSVSWTDTHVPLWVSMCNLRDYINGFSEDIREIMDNFEVFGVIDAGKI